MHLTYHRPIEFPELSEKLADQKISDIEDPDQKKTAREVRVILNSAVKLRRRLTALQGFCERECDPAFLVNDPRNHRHQCLICGRIPTRINQEKG